MMGWEQNSFIIKYGLGHILYKLLKQRENDLLVEICTAGIWFNWSLHRINKSI